MELMQLEMFVAVVEERSVQRAADRVSRTQPAVSIAVRKLEQDIGTILLDRSRRRDYRLTRAGEFLYEYASRMIGLRNEVLSRLKGETSGCTGRLAIGVSGPTSLRWVPRFTNTFRARNPNVRVEISDDRPDKLLRELADRRIDLAFLSDYPANNRVNSDVVLTPLATFTKDGSLWLVQPRIGRSHAVNMFTEMISSRPATSMRGPHGKRLKKSRLYVPSSQVERRNSQGDSEWIGRHAED